ncbi:MAG: hypothetical protein KC609_18690 [Myxococcales bacterium]|nr:hypothetical protein [Myxococcales bacterium]
MLGGVAVMFGVQTGAGILLGLMGISRLGTLPLVLIALVAFALGGFLVGRFSKGKTILEPAVSAVIAVALAMFVKGHFNLLAIVIGGILPFLAALAGGWLGEKAQGTI